MCGWVCCSHLKCCEGSRYNLEHRPAGIYCILHNVSAYLPSYKAGKYAVCVSTFEEVDRFFTNLAMIILVLGTPQR